ncbi:nuclear transport factor 2 family protein [Bradyrhizobium prioriisuperbiae]|uniref:nuclear transport factor 2 family protein n=1 Tax=Bradyrhizobium prioriisuperbiae TaxID=2854389 RepID=UPI0028F0EC27|nr:nuclear transport factor 2 family protein [Bradyrhizobium prioritasuperba]
MQQALQHQASEAMGTLSALNARFIHNYVTRDVTSHEAILHPRFINITPTGLRQERAAYLRFWATGFDPDTMVYYDVRDERISIFGDVVLVRATTKSIRRRDGEDIMGMTTYTDIYQFEKGTWTCIQAQITPVAPEHHPADDTIVNVYIDGQLQQ